LSDKAGNLFIVSGPSGAGKSALAASVLASVPNLHFSISYTTRAPRGSERDGVEYYFVTKEDFWALERGGLLLEWAEIYGNLYGTSQREIDEILARGGDVLLDIDVQGARTLRQKRPEGVSVFILPPSYQVLRERLERRSLDKAYEIEQRLRIAGQEIRQYVNYDYLIINEVFEQSAEELKAIIIGNRCRSGVRSGNAETIVATFGGINAEHP
jgi:guanylate kinase